MLSFRDYYSYILLQLGRYCKKNVANLIKLFIDALLRLETVEKFGIINVSDTINRYGI